MRQDPRTQAGSRADVADHRDGPRVVVVGIDDSPIAQRAACYAAGLARRNDAVLTILHVRWPLPPTSWFCDLGAPLDFGPEDGGASVFVDEIAELSERQYGVRIVREGRAADEIAKVADERRADAVVVGCPLHAIHRLIPSIGTRLARRGSWPVTVVP